MLHRPPQSPTPALTHAQAQRPPLAAPPAHLPLHPPLPAATVTATTTAIGTSGEDETGTMTGAEGMSGEAIEKGNETGTGGTGIGIAMTEEGARSGSIAMTGRGGTIVTGGGRLARIEVRRIAISPLLCSGSPRACARERDGKSSHDTVREDVKSIQHERGATTERNGNNGARETGDRRKK